MIISDKTCDNCSEKGPGIFDPDSSSTFEYVTIPERDIDQITVGGLILDGYWGKDTIKLHTLDENYLQVENF